MHTRSKTIAAREIAAAPATECRFFKIPTELRNEIYSLALIDPELELKDLKRPALLNICQRIRVESLAIYGKQIHEALEEGRLVCDELREEYRGLVPRQRGWNAAHRRYCEAWYDHEEAKQVAKKEWKWITEESKKQN